MPFSSSQECRIWEVSSHKNCEEKAFYLAEEVPIEFIYNGVLSYAVIMATPCDLEDFAIGFSLSEALIESPASCRSISWKKENEGIRLEINIEQSQFQKILRRDKRNLIINSSCGLCGIENIKNLDHALPALDISHKYYYSFIAIRKGLKALPSQQILNQKVRMLHAAAWMSLSGEIMIVREDIGRHNALDKLVGILKKNHHDLSQGICLLTSRCSFEMAQKAILAGINCLVSVSAPTVKAVKIAQEAKLHLAGLARDNSQIIFNNPGFFSDF